MKVTIVGAGNVGQAFGVALKTHGHSVTLHDIITKEIPEGFELSLDFFDACRDTEAVVVSVPTEMNHVGECDVNIFSEVIQKFGVLSTQNPYKRLFIQKSTCPPGTADFFIKFLKEEFQLENGKDYYYIVFPSFLNMGTPIEDELSQKKCLVGCSESEDAKKIIGDLLCWTQPIFSNYKNVEFAKYVNNIFHAGILSIWNELYLLAEKVDVDTDWVAKITPQERGLESVYRVHGQAWGGVCLPKDTNAFLRYAEKMGVQMPLLQSIIEVNNLMAKKYGIRTAHWKDLMGNGS